MRKHPSVLKYFSPWSTDSEAFKKVVCLSTLISPNVLCIIFKIVTVRRQRKIVQWKIKFAQKKICEWLQDSLSQHSLQSVKSIFFLLLFYFIWPLGHSDICRWPNLAKSVLSCSKPCNIFFVSFCMLGSGEQQWREETRRIQSLLSRLLEPFFWIRTGCSDLSSCSIRYISQR